MVTQLTESVASISPPPAISIVVCTTEPERRYDPLPAGIGVRGFQSFKMLSTAVDAGGGEVDARREPRLDTKTDRQVR